MGLFITSIPLGTSLCKPSSKTGYSPFLTVKITGFQLCFGRYLTNFNQRCTPAPPEGGQ